MPQQHVILFVAANPLDTNHLALDEECAAIQKELRMTAHRDRFQFQSRWATTVDELFRCLHETQPRILHFSGHGGGSSGIVLQDESGRAHEVSARALAMTVEAVTKNLSVVVLNACSTAAQADVLTKHVDVVVGMSGAIGDSAARSFAVGFYRGLGYGDSVQNAFRQGVATLAAKNLPDEALPRCLNGLGGVETFLDPQ